MSTATSWKALEDKIARVVKQARGAVAVSFRDSEPADVKKFEGTEPSGCSFWRLAAEGKTFYTVPENHYNCAVGAYTHNIALSAEREKETEQTLKMMFDLGYVKQEEVPQIPRLAKGPKTIVYSPLGDAHGRAGCGAVRGETSGGDAAAGSGKSRRSGRGGTGAGKADVHGAAGVAATRDDHQPGMHREPRVHGPGRRRDVRSNPRERSGARG